jgi:hypothetical protein
MNYINGKYKKEKGVLKPLTISAIKQYEKFVSKLPEGTIVEFFYEQEHDDGTLPQLAKLHVMLKQLSMHIGETVENMKLLVKDRAGLCIAREVAGKEYFLAKSFGDCSRDELCLAIQAAIELGEEVNFPLH